MKILLFLGKMVCIRLDIPHFYDIFDIIGLLLVSNKSRRGKVNTENYLLKFDIHYSNTLS